MLYTSLYSLFKAQQIILYEISSIAAVNNELYRRQGKGRTKRGCINFDTPSILGGMSENLCQEDLSESSDSTKIESEKNDSIYYRRVIPTHSTK